ncbi:HdeD family acid-resistance protein [Povalibacter sp.]|uniref:HdeD family acid-resistance protein n=1 Tax=Povalibacter sp. TaxID=1962978 RepID=UPI002F4135C6
MPLSALVQGAAKHWWLVVLRGVFAIAFGALAWLWPGVTVLVLVLLWGIYALADGIVALITAFRWRDSGKPLWPLILMGLVGIAAGIVAFAAPGITAIVLLLFIAAWAVIIGVLQILTAIRLRQEIDNEWLLGLAGLVSLLFGILMIVRPGAGALAVVWIISLYAIFFGVLLVMLGFRLKGLRAA